MKQDLANHKKNIRRKRGTEFEHSPPKTTIQKILLGGIGSFLMVIFFPQGVKYFFRNMFAEIVSALVTIILAGLLTQKFADTFTKNVNEAKR